MSGLSSVSAKTGGHVAKGREAFSQRRSISETVIRQATKVLEKLVVAADQLGDKLDSDDLDETLSAVKSLVSHLKMMNSQIVLVRATIEAMDRLETSDCSKSELFTMMNGRETHQVSGATIMTDERRASNNVSSHSVAVRPGDLGASPAKPIKFVSRRQQPTSSAASVSSAFGAADSPAPSVTTVVDTPVSNAGRRRAELATPSKAIEQAAAKREAGDEESVIATCAVSTEKTSPLERRPLQG